MHVRILKKKLNFKVNYPLELSRISCKFRNTKLFYCKKLKAKLAVNYSGFHITFGKFKGKKIQHILDANSSGNYRLMKYLNQPL